MRRAQIAAIECFLPAETLTNEELARRFSGWTAAAIEQKTGIKVRHVAAPNQTAADLAVEAAERLFATGKAERQGIDWLLHCTQTPDYPLPATACLLQDRLGLPATVAAVDINQGCSGFVYGVALATGLIEAQLAENVLLLTADTYTKLVHPTDRALLAIFGDGAAATLVHAVTASDEAPPLLGPFVFGTDGAGAQHLIVRDGGLRSPLLRPVDVAASTRDLRDAYLWMDGPAIFSFTLARIPDLVRAVYARSHASPEEIAWFVFHQANRFMLESLRSQINLPKDRFVLDLEDKGNTVSSSIPIALHGLSSTGRITTQQRVMMIGFGVGLSWAGTLATLPGPL